MMASSDLPVGELGEIRDVRMPGAGGDIALRLFDPRANRAAGPVVVFYHGGGFIVGGVDTHAGLAAEIARHLDLPVISVEYRLAPENRWPAATDDGREFTSLILTGDSAGGTVTLVTAAALRDKPAALPVVMQMPIYPVADLSKSYPSGAEFADGFALDSKNMDYYGEAYRSDVTDRRASPLLDDLAGLPPTLLCTAGLDPLRDQGRAYAAAVIEAGGRLTYREFAGTIHGFCTYRASIPSARQDLAQLLDLAAAMLKEIGVR
jgi:acetyl esterase